MQPTLEIFNQLTILLAADTATIAPAANPPKLKLSKAAFTPNQNNVPADFTEADFDGYAPIAAIVGAQNVGVDPLTQERLVEMKIPAGGWRWVVTGLTNLPQQIFGAYLTDNAGAIVFGAALFDGPITLDNLPQVVEVGSVTFRFRFNGVF